MKKMIVLLLSGFILITAFQNKSVTITGSVMDDTGNPIPFAAVHAGRTAVVADASGNYSITIDEKEEYLNFSAAGCSPLRVKIGNKRLINAIMQRSAGALTEVVVTAPGIARSGVRQKVNGNHSSSALLSKNFIGYTTNNDKFNTEEYGNIVENGFRKVIDEPLSTFSIDVDAASYSNVRRYLNGDELPPAGAVRTEELINYFTYQYLQPNAKDPFSINTEVSGCPWNKNNKLVLIGLQGKNIPVENLPPSNLVFLIDVSGSMMDDNKLPLVKASLKMLADQLRENDRISIVVYAGEAGLVLPSTSGSNKIKIKTAIDALEAGGSTAGGAGIELAYKAAQENFMKEGNNRVILCTDGDFNVGVSSDDDMVSLIEKERSKGIFLTVLGYGTGNYKDSKMQQLADKGNGNHAYIDGINEAKKVLVNEFSGTLFTIAKDVKLQIEFNPAKVAGYRLIGYENRLLNKEDFNDDKKDAGELGSGHTVTALYEITPAGVISTFLKEVDPLKYQNKEKKAGSFDDEMLTVKFRYKAPYKGNNQLIVRPVNDKDNDFNNTSENFRFATAVAGFAMLLRNSEYKGDLTFPQVVSIANASLGEDVEGYRKEFVSLVQKAEMLMNEKATK